MARPMLWVFIFLAGGILVGRNFGLGGWLVALGIAAVVLAGLCYAIYRRKIAVILPLFALLGAISAYNVINPTDAVLEEVALREGFVRVEGIVQDISLTRTGRQRVSIDTNFFIIGASPERHYSSLRIQAFLPDGEETVLGQRVLVSGYLQTLEGVRNPGGFNEFQFLRSRGIEYRLFAESVEMYDINMTIGMHIRSFGLRLSDVFHQVLPPDMAGIMSAMIVGDRSGLDNDIRDLYSSVGMFHILVVSGLHVNILALFFGAALKFLGVKSNKARGLATIGFIVVFAIMTGAGVATVRASIMGIAFILTKLFGFQNDSTTSLSIAAVALLLFQPLFLFDIGFIYSFTTVAALIYLSPAIKKILPKYVANNFVSSTFAATVVYMIINSLMSFEFSLYSPLVNLLLLPTVSIVVILGFLTALVGLVSTTFASIFAMPVWVLLSFYERVMEAVSHAPFSTVLTGRPSTVTLITLSMSIIAFIIIINGNKKRVAKSLLVVVSVAFVTLAAQFAVNTLNPHINTTFLYVGQGDSAVISRGSNAIIIDGGGAFGRELGENTGILTLIPYLSYRGVPQATAIITHNHSDHAIGIVEAIMAGRIEHLILAQANSEPENYAYNLAIGTAQEMGISVTYVSSGDVIEFFDMRLYILSPHYESNFRSENDNSLVIRAVHGDFSMLFTGDIESTAENYLVQSGTNINTDILQVAHHGSRSSTTEAFLQTSSPQFAIISAGRNSMFGHPHAEVTNRLDAHGVNWMNTATHGAITVRTNGRSMTINTMLGGH